MIDLRIKGLPNIICVNGEPFSIYTDFREWLKFGEMIKEKRKLKEYAFLFKNKVPTDTYFEQLMGFYINKNVTPKASKGANSEKILDYILDGEYILGSFMAEYGIDLTETDMHWHKFQALFRSLPETSYIMQIMSKRCYKKTTEKMETQLKKAKTTWSFPTEKALDFREMINDPTSEFFGCK